MQDCWQGRRLFRGEYFQGSWTFHRDCFIYTYSDIQIDFAAVAGKLNITKSAANKRFSRLRISMKARESKDEQLKDEELKDDLDDSEMPQFEESLED